MNVFLLLLLLTLLAGLAMPFGALIASIVRFKNHELADEFVHFVVAFGGGALLSAVALVLVPEGLSILNPLLACVCFILGGLIFMAIDIYLQRKQTSASQLLAMLTDFVPESIALGAALAIGNSSAFLLASLIALQNIPEGFNAYNELRASSRRSSRNIIWLFALMSLLGPVAALGGYYWMFAHIKVLAATVLIAAGGILYSVFQDIAPKAKLDSHWAPPMGAVTGFMLGMLGSALVA